MKPEEFIEMFEEAFREHHEPGDDPLPLARKVLEGAKLLLQAAEAKVQELERGSGSLH